MTSRERINTAFLHKQPDRTPIFEYVLFSSVADMVLGRPYVADYEQNFNNWVEYAKELGFEKALRQYAVDRVQLTKKLEHDLMYIVPNPLPEIIHANYINKSKQNYELVDSDPVEEVKKRNISAKEELAKTTSKDHTLIYHYIKEEMNKNELDIPIYAPAFYHGVWTDVELMQTMLLEPDVAHEHFQLMTKKAEKRIDDFLEIDLDIIGIGGDFAGNRPLISSECYKTFIVPELKKLSDRIHKNGKYVVNASDGDLWNVIDDFLITSGVDAYGEVDYGAGMNLKKLKKRYGDKITFLGNMSSGDILSYGSLEEITKLTIQCIEDGYGNGGHIFTASNAITASVPLENYITMVNTYRDYYNMKKFTF